MRFAKTVINTNEARSQQLLSKLRSAVSEGRSLETEKH